MAETASAQASATAQMESFNAVIDQLMTEGVITTKEGDYHHLEDFYQSWAQLGWYRWWPTDYSAEIFVLSANTYWQSASNTADWYTSGCGEKNHFGETKSDFMNAIQMAGGPNVVPPANSGAAHTLLALHDIQGPEVACES